MASRLGVIHKFNFLSHTRENKQGWLPAALKHISTVIRMPLSAEVRDPIYFLPRNAMTFWGSSLCAGNPVSSQFYMRSGVNDYLSMGPSNRSKNFLTIILLKPLAR